ncbi:uncharacterized protein LOC133817839 [Humulus lupulus]|uniref:uncharacterized protein LOC133817839 n=1 Tax=Humulus lupulus TaxID=3486 RepID=UPI002B407D79|nr:uncharacterized protein LOC133817839 [Humulus lupulus]XP_062106442.1 uncharacterized protein LOC133817839 [Humulus lupulus]
MAETVVSATTGKKLIEIDISSDTVCPWCFVGKKNLDKAIAASKDQYDFEIRWHPFQLEPNAPKEGVDKKEFYREKFGSQTDRMQARMMEVYKNLGLEYNFSGLTGNTLDSHRLVNFAGKQGSEKQHKLMEELFLGYFTQAKYIGDWEFLVQCADKAGVEGAVEFLQDPKNGVNEVKEELKMYSTNISGVPFFLINKGKQKLSGAQPPEGFLRAFEIAST